MTSYKNLYLEQQAQCEALARQFQDLQLQVQAAQAAAQDALADRDEILAAKPEDMAELLAELMMFRRDRGIIDLVGIARHMHVNELTPQQWNQRGLLPRRDFPEIKHPLWYARTVRDQFAIRTGRPWYDGDEPAEEPAA